MIENQLPEDIDSEKSLLATLCAPGADQAAADCIPLLREDDFVHPAHRALFKALALVVEKGLEITPFSLTSMLGDGAGTVGGFSGVVSVLDGMEVVRPRNLIDILVAHRKRRELIRLGFRMAQDARALDTPPETIADECAGVLAGMATGNRGGMATSGDCVIQVLADLECDHIPGTITGFNVMDGITQGFQPGQMIILAARPGIGKTALALNWTLRASSQGPVLFFSLEMGKRELIRRMACNLGDVPQRAVKERSLTQHQDGAFRSALARLRGLPIHINDDAAITAHEIKAHVQRHAVKSGVAPSLVVVDHIGLVSSPDLKGKSEANRIGDISRTFKVLAKSTGCPVVVLSQLNREVEKADRKPILSDLRDSGCLEQDADIVMFIHRKPKPQMPDAPPDRTANLIIAKHRDGELAEIPMEFHGGYCRYEEISRSTDDVPYGRGF